MYGEVEDQMRGFENGGGKKQEEDEGEGSTKSGKMEE